MTDRFATSMPDMPRHKGRRIGTLWFSDGDGGSGECDVTLSPLFDDLDPVTRLDCLRDAISILEWEYEDQKKKFTKILDGKSGRHTNNKE